MSQSSLRTWTDVLDRAVETEAARLVAVRRHLHMHPEPSGHEFATTAYLAEHLQSAGFDVVVAPSGRGLTVDGPRAGIGPRIALRADIDALHVQDAKSVAYCSQVPGVMHACGHDAHAAVVLGAVLALRTAAAEGALPWPTDWRAVWQPAEETSRGADEMIEAGALDGIAAILGMHVDPSRLAGRIGLRAGVATAACDEIDIRIDGRGGHAARPHESIDPIVAAAQLVQAIYAGVSRHTDAQDPVVVTFGQITGGDTQNVIPDRVRLRGTLRTLDAHQRTRMKDRILRQAAGVSELSDARIHVEFVPGPPSVVNDEGLIDLLRRAAEGVVGADGVERVARPSMGGEDFACYLDHVPGAMFRLGCGTSPGGPFLHSPLFDLDERAVAIGARTLARAVVLAAGSREPAGGRDAS